VRNSATDDRAAQADPGYRSRVRFRATILQSGKLAAGRIR
jgi:hypothetical protein